MSSDTSSRLTRADVERAAERLHGHVRRTPMLVLDREPDRPQIALKLECLQVSGSFKIRGATNRILLDGGRHERVVATSGGNHGIAVAHVSRRLGLRADLFVTPHAPAYKMRAIEAAGARVHRADPSQDLVSVAREFAEEHSALYVHSFDDPGVVAGQGTLGLEILEEHPDATHVVLAVGGGGLGAGIAVAVGERVRLVPVEPSLCPTLAAALEAGHPVPVEVGGVAADALGALRLSELAYALLSPLIRTVPLVGEDEILAAQRQLWKTYRLAVEPAAACAWAAVIGGGAEFEPDARVVVVVCGANVDLAALAERGSS